MNRHKLLVLGGVAVVALAAALWSTGTRTPVQDTTPSQALVPGLEAKLNDVTTVRVRGPGDQVLATLVREGDGWRVSERNWPADVEKLRAYLLKLAQARRVEEKTSNPALYDRLGVEPVDAPDAYGTQLELDGIEPPVRLIVGRNVPRGSGTYARFAGEPRSWEANADLAVERNPANWLQRDLADVAAKRIARVEIVPAQGAPIRIERAAKKEGAGEFMVANVPKGREPATEFVADAAGGLLSGLRFDDLPTQENAPLPATGRTVATFVTDDGLTVTSTSWVQDEKTYARFTATLDEAKAGTAQALRDEAAQLARRFADRTFVLPPYKADVLNKPLEAYLKPKA
jgi:hypothetical protein